MSPEAPVETVLYCSQCGRTFAPSDLVQIAGNWVCADCKPAFLSRVMASGAAGASPMARHYGGLWIRFGARCVDGLVFLVPTVLLLAMVMPALMRALRQAGNSPSASNTVFAAFGFGLVTLFVVVYVAGGVYEILLLRYKSATVGKMACGLKVIRSDGRALSWGVCFGRFFMWNIVTQGIPYLNFILMLASSVILGLDDEKRALHDWVCDTRVIYTQG